MSATTEQKISIELTRPIVLVGLMGAGKTSVGKRLATFLDVPFKDSDHEIEAAAGMEVREIFERHGEAYFRAGECRVIQRLISEPPGVLATGGGAFMSPEIRDAIAQKGRSVWIDADLEVLWNRVKDRGTRPLLQQPRPREVLADLLETRRPCYALADLRVTSSAQVSQDRMVARILRAIRSHDLAHPSVPATLRRRQMS